VAARTSGTRSVSEDANEVARRDIKTSQRAAKLPVSGEMPAVYLGRVEIDVRPSNGEMS
jgi:hypothetical protein